MGAEAHYFVSEMIMKTPRHIDKNILHSPKHYLLHGLFYFIYGFFKNLPFPLCNYLRFASLLIFGAKVKSPSIGEGVTVFCPWDLEIGANTTIGARCTLTAFGGLKIGNDVRIAPNVMILTTDHEYSKPDLKIRDQGFKQAAIEIGNDVWLAGNVVVVKGVQIGDGVVIGANSVVTHDIPPYSIAAGAPCRVIKKRK
jgi:acetyltransferase-like isoleucine patch superfamily enzyme